MFLSKSGKLLIHITGWILLFSLIIAFTFANDNRQHAWKSTINAAFLLMAAFYIFLFYINSEILLPAFYSKKSYLIYGIIILALLILAFFLKPFDHFMSGNREMRSPPMPPPGMNMPGGERPHPPNQRAWRLDIISIILFFMVWSISFALHVFRQWRITEQRAARAEADKANAELSFLKAQINPHFLFNTLNNIYSLAVTKSESTPGAVMKLSNILHYVTDETGADFVPLKNEIDCLGDYIELQKMRLGSKTRVHFAVEGNINGNQIAPLILMSFVENVFKYGVSSHEPSVINISVVANEKTIDFHSANKNFDSQTKIERKGIGISNTIKRLEHLYPGKHQLKISKEAGMFTVNLTLQS